MHQLVLQHRLLTDQIGTELMQHLPPTGVCKHTMIVIACLLLPFLPVQSGTRRLWLQMEPLRRCGIDGTKRRRLRVCQPLRLDGTCKLLVVVKEWLREKRRQQKRNRGGTRLPRHSLGQVWRARLLVLVLVVLSDSSMSQAAWQAPPRPPHWATWPSAWPRQTLQRSWHRRWLSRCVGRRRWTNVTDLFLM